MILGTKRLVERCGRVRSHVLVVAVLFCTLVSEPVASGEDAADVAAARSLFRQGSRLAKAGDWKGARDHYTRSLALKHSPMTLYSLAIAQQKTGSVVDALENLRAFLTSERSERAHAFDARARKEINALEQRVGRAIIVVTPAQATGLVVRIDGRRIPLEALGHPRLLDPGKHSLTIAAPAFRSVRRTLKVAEGATQTVRVALKRVPQPTAQRDPQPIEGDASALVLPLALMGGGAVLIGVGIGVGVSAQQDAKAAVVDTDEQAVSARNKAIAADVLYGAGAAVGVAGLVVLLVQHIGDDDEQPDAAIGLRPWVSRGQAGLQLSF